jgi:uncharacterized protein YndB with AHSA1/START domain
MKSEAKVEGKRLEITHVFDAPRSEVFEYWAKAEKLQRWSGCKETTRCEVVMDFRAGGSFTQKMQIAVGGGTCEFSFTGFYEEIVVPEKIVYRADLGKGIIRVIVEFFDQGAGTRVVLTQDGFAEPGACKIVSQGTLESLEKLDSILAGQEAVNRS